MNTQTAADALRAGDPALAERLARAADDDHRTAEALIAQGHLARADEVLSRCSSHDPQTLLLMAMVARGKGDRIGAIGLLERASEHGSKEARDLLASGRV